MWDSHLAKVRDVWGSHRCLWVLVVLIWHEVVHCLAKVGDTGACGCLWTLPQWYCLGIVYYGYWIYCATALDLCGMTSYPLTICKGTSNEHKSKLSFILSQPRLINIPIEIQEGIFPILSTCPVNSSSSNPHMCHIYHQDKEEDPKIVWVGDEADV